MPRSVKVVKLNEPQPEIKQEEKPQEIQEEREEIEQVVEASQEQQEPDETKDDDLNSEDLDHLVKEYTKQQKLKKQKSEPKSECQHCGKSMSSKSLKYTHQKNCKSDPKNRPPSPTPPLAPPPPSLQPLSTPEPNLRPKPKSRPPRKTIVKQKMVEQEEVPYEIQTSDVPDVKEPLTTSYIKLMELQRSAKVQQTKQRMKNLASQAF